MPITTVFTQPFVLLKKFKLALKAEKFVLHTHYRVIMVTVARSPLMAALLKFMGGCGK